MMIAEFAAAAERFAPYALVSALVSALAYGPDTGWQDSAMSEADAAESEALLVDDEPKEHRWARDYDVEPVTHYEDAKGFYYRV